MKCETEPRPTLSLKMRLLASLISFMSAAHVLAANLTWSQESGGAIDDPGNWNTAAIYAEDNLRVRRQPSGNLTLNGDISVAAMEIGYGSLALDITLDLGADRTLFADSFSVMHGRTAAQLLSGRVCASYIYVGSGAGGAKFTVSGESARVSLSSAENNKFITIGHNGAYEGTEMSVLNGAELEGPVRFGHGGSYRSSLLVSGTGTRWDMLEVDSRIGCLAESWGNTVILADGATAIGDANIGAVECSVSNSLVMCGEGTTWSRPSRPLYIGGYTGANFSAFVVSNGAVYASDQPICLGQSSKESNLSIHNRLLVADGAVVSVPNVMFGGNSNTVEISGNGATLVLPSQPNTILYLKGFGNEIVLRNGGAMALTNGMDSLYVTGGGNRFTVDGGRLEVGASVRLGSGAVGAGDSRIVVENGGIFKSGGNAYLYVGHEVFASNNLLKVGNGGMFDASSATDEKMVVVGNKNGYGNLLLVDGGEFDAGEASLIIGLNGDTDEGIGGNGIAVVNGGHLSAGKITVGRMCPGARLAVDDASVSAASIEASHEATYALASNAVVSVTGVRGSIALSGSFILSKSAKLKVYLSGSPSVDASVSAGSFTFADGAEILVDVAEDARINMRKPFVATILKSSNNDIDLSNVTLKVNADAGLSVVYGDAKTLKVRYRPERGTVIVVR